MNDFSDLRDEEESDRIREIRQLAQTQFVDLSDRFVTQSKELERVKSERDRYRNAYASSSRRASELGQALRDELS